MYAEKERCNEEAVAGDVVPGLAGGLSAACLACVDGEFRRTVRGEKRREGNRGAVRGGGGGQVRNRGAGRCCRRGANRL